MRRSFPARIERKKIGKGLVKRKNEKGDEVCVEVEVEVEVEEEVEEE